MGVYYTAIAYIHINNCTSTILVYTCIYIEAICCCLQTCCVDVKLLLMDFMCIPTFIYMYANEIAYLPLLKHLFIALDL